MGKAQRTKGARFELQVCAEIADKTGYPAHRNLSQTRDGGFDIRFGKFKLECKSRKSISVYSFIEQCQAACEQGDVPVVIMKADRKKPLVMMYLDDALPILAGELTDDDFESVRISDY